MTDGDRSISVTSRPDEYTCSVCRETFDYEWTDEEAMAEAEAIFGDSLGDDPAVVCDDCWHKMGLG